MGLNPNQIKKLYITNLKNWIWLKSRHYETEEKVFKTLKSYISIKLSLGYLKLLTLTLKEL